MASAYGFFMKALQGAAAGAAATLPMTLWLNRPRRRPTLADASLPPAQIGARVLDRAAPVPVTGAPRKAFVNAAHYGYGAAAASLYVLADPRPGLLRGTLYGTAVWAVSYFGLLPALRLYPPPTSDSPRRTREMIAAHWIWGAAAGLMLRTPAFRRAARLGGGGLGPRVSVDSPA